MQDFANEFVTSARHTLSFLESDHGFKEESVTIPPDSNSVYTTYMITYVKRLDELPHLRVRLNSTPARGELLLECAQGNFTNPDQTVTAQELMAIATRGTSVEFKHLVSDAIGRPGIMQEHFTVLAEALRLHGRRFFDLDQSLWEDVRRNRESRRQRSKREEQDRDRQRAVHESGFAFKAKDWSRVVALLQGLAHDLTEAQSERLNYAKKQLQKLG